MKFILLLAIFMYLGSSCEKEREEPFKDTVQTEKEYALELSLVLDDVAFRALSFEATTDNNGRLLPQVKFADGQTVKVNTIISTEDGSIWGGEELDWVYTSAKDGKPATLVLRGEHAKINLSAQDEAAFNNTKTWYLTGMIGGKLDKSNKRIVMSPTDGTVVRSLQPTVSGGGFSLGVPYAFPWTKLHIYEQPRVGAPKLILDTDGEMKPSTVRFAPQGALVGYILGNQIENPDVTTFTTTGFNVTSEAFGDTGYFDAIKPLAEKVPTWHFAKKDCRYQQMEYTFASPLAPIAKGHTLGSRYFAWVMPQAGAPASPNTSIVYIGTAQGNEPTANEPADKINPYSGMWFTNYGQASGTTRTPKSGMVYSMRAEVQSPVKLPIQYVAESSLAGGEPGAVYSNGYVLERRLVNNVKMEANINTTDIEWHKGPLRFSAVKVDPNNGAFLGLHDTPLQSIHANRTGLYLWPVAVGGFVHENLDPTVYSPKSILDYPLYDQDGQVIENASSKYHIPDGDELWGAFGSRVYWTNNSNGYRFWGNINGDTPTPGRTANNEKFRIGGSPTRFVRYTTKVRGLGSDQIGDSFVSYYIRFLKPDASAAPVQQKMRHNDPLPTCFPKAHDSRLACVYRYTFNRRPGGITDESNKPELRDVFVTIDVVHVGVEGETMTLSDIKSKPDSWWTKQGNPQKFVGTKYLSYPGYLGDRKGTFSVYTLDDSEKYLMNRGTIMRILGQGLVRLHQASVHVSEVHEISAINLGFAQSGVASITNPMSIRPFYNK